jgi:hypothetical protein
MKFAKGFGRRKSSGNALEYEQPPEQAHSSFRVLERPQASATISFDSAPSVARRFSGGRLFGSSQQRPSGEDDSAGSNRLISDDITQEDVWRLTENRGSGGSGGTTASTSTGYYDSSSAASARYSSHSTLPTPDQDDELFPVKKANTFHPDALALKDLPPPPPRHKDRTFSFGRLKKSSTAEVPRPKTGVEPVPLPSTVPMAARERAQTTSSYATESSHASTVVPAQNDPSPTLDLADSGDDFSNMFNGFGKRSSVTLESALKKTSTPPPAPLPRSVSNATYGPVTSKLTLAFVGL